MSAAPDQLRSDRPRPERPHPERPGIVGYVPGVWDMFHVGHLTILSRARPHCDHLIVGAVTDDVVRSTKGHPPVVPLGERMEILGGLRLVDEVVVDTARDKTVVWSAVGFDVIFKGDDWQGTPKGDRLERDMGALGVRVVYFPYTPHTSSSMLRALIAARTGVPA